MNVRIFKHHPKMQLYKKSIIYNIISRQKCLSHHLWSFAFKLQGYVLLLLKLVLSKTSMIYKLSTYLRLFCCEKSDTHFWIGLAHLYYDKWVFFDFRIRGPHLSGKLQKKTCIFSIYMIIAQGKFKNDFLIFSPLIFGLATQCYTWRD